MENLTEKEQNKENLQQAELIFSGLEQFIKDRVTENAWLLIKLKIEQIENKKEDLKKAEYLLFVLKQIFGKQNADKLESQNKTENLKKENKSLTDINIKLLSKIQRIENTMILKGIMFTQNFDSIIRCNKGEVNYTKVSKIDTTKDSSKASTGNSIIEKLTETREELGDLESSNISVPKETEILSNSSKLSQNIHKFDAEKGSSKTSTGDSLDKQLTQTTVEPDGSQNYIESVSKETEVVSNSYKLSKNLLISDTEKVGLKNVGRKQGCKRAVGYKSIPGKANKIYSSIRKVNADNENLCHIKVIPISTTNEQSDGFQLDKNVSETAQSQLETSSIYQEVKYPPQRQPGRVECPTCGKTYSNWRNYTKHRKIHDENNPHKCEHCDKAFVSKAALNVHRRRHTKEKPFECETCHKKFVCKASLKQHMETHEEGKKWKCPLCPGEGKWYKTRNSLRSHMQFHGEKRQECEVCGKKFHSKSNLLGHMVYHYEPTHSCELCGNLFYNLASLRRHKKNVHKLK